MCEHGGEENEIEGFVFEGEPVFRGFVLAFGVVALAMHVGLLELEGGEFRGDAFGAPVDPIGDDIDSLVASLFDVPGQRDRHAANAAAYIQNLVCWLQSSLADEVLQKFIADHFEIAIADEDLAAWRSQFIPEPKRAFENIHEEVAGLPGNGSQWLEGSLQRSADHCVFVLEKDGVEALGGSRALAEGAR